MRYLVWIDFFFLDAVRNDRDRLSFIYISKPHTVSYLKEAHFHQGAAELEEWVLQVEEAGEGLRLVLVQ